MNELVLRELRAGILRLTLNDPATRNSLSQMMIKQLHAALDEPNARVIIIGAHGPAFSSGHNLKEITSRRTDADEGRNFFKSLFDQCADLMLAITNNPCPVIAEIDGLASAAGCQLVATCDLAIAAEEAAFATPGVKIGLFCTTPMVALTRAIGRNREIRAVILAASGKVFCSGHDLGQMTGRDINEYRQIFDVCSDLMQKVQSIPQPVIAEVQGIATAAGCQLVATCDLAIAADEAAFAKAWEQGRGLSVEDAVARALSMINPSRQ